MWGKLMNAVCKSTASDTLASMWQGGEFQHRNHMEKCEGKEYLRPFQRESREFLLSKEKEEIGICCSWSTSYSPGDMLQG